MDELPKARADPSRREMRSTAQIFPYIWEPVVCGCEHDCEWEFGSSDIA